MDYRESLRKLTKIGYSLSAEKDIDKLLHLILHEAREMLSCDSGTIYVKRKGADGSERLEFSDVQNDSIHVELERSSLPVAHGTIPGYAAASGETVLIEDAYALKGDGPYGFSKAFDERTGYRTVSIMAIPMKDKSGEVIGVISLYNKKKDPGARLVTPGNRVVAGHRELRSNERRKRQQDDRDHLVVTAQEPQCGTHTNDPARCRNHQPY